MIKKNTLFIFIGFFAGLVNGLLGSAGGTVLVPSLVFLSNIVDYKAHATAIAIVLPLTIISSLVYLKYGIASIQLTLYTTLGTMIGAYIGSRLLNKLSISLLRKIFGFFMIVAAFRMVF